MPRRSVAEAVAGSMSSGGSETAIVQEFDAMRADTLNFALSEQEMNRLGYFFLSRGAPAAGSIPWVVMRGMLPTPRASVETAHAR